MCNEVQNSEKFILLAEEAVRIQPDDSIAHYSLGFSYLKNGRFDEAVTHFKESIRLDPDYTAAHVCLSNAYLEIGRYEDAMNASKEAIRTNVENVEAHLSLGHAYIKLERFEAAITSFENAKDLILSPVNHLWLWGPIGRLILPKKERDEYRQTMDASALIDLLIGECYGELGRYDEAVNSFLSVMYSHYGNPAVHFKYGDALLKLGDKKGALAEYKNLIELDTGLAQKLFDEIYKD
jgi:tetratricopeptide (TPR) repeat protein